MKKQIVTAISALILSSVGTVNAESLTNTLVVSADVDVTCVFTVVSIDFGTYNGAHGYADGSINVTCSNLTPYWVALDAGENFVLGRRNIQDEGGVNLIPYELTADLDGSGEPQPVGDTGYGDTFVADPISEIGTGVEQVHTIYGQLQGGIFVPAGSYFDVVNVSVNF